MSDSLLIPFDDVEFWKPVVGYEGLYEVSNLGRVKSLNYKRTGKEKIMKPFKDGGGYFRIELRNKPLYVHNIVWEAFKGAKPSGMEIDHIDRNKLNNCISNLRCVTHKENMNNPLTRKVHVDAIRKMLKERHKDPEFTKMLTEASVKARSKQVNQYTIDGKFVNTWPSEAEAGRELNLNSKNISACCTGRRKTAYGFIWKHS